MRRKKRRRKREEKEGEEEECIGIEDEGGMYSGEEEEDVDTKEEVSLEGTV